MRLSMVFLLVSALFVVACRGEYETSFAGKLQQIKHTLDRAAIEHGADADVDEFLLMSRRLLMTSIAYGGYGVYYGGYGGYGSYGAYGAYGATGLISGSGSTQTIGSAEATVAGAAAPGAKAASAAVTLLAAACAVLLGTALV